MAFLTPLLSRRFRFGATGTLPSGGGGGGGDGDLAQTFGIFCGGVLQIQTLDMFLNLYNVLGLERFEIFTVRFSLDSHTLGLIF